MVWTHDCKCISEGAVETSTDTCIPTNDTVNIRLGIIDFLFNIICISIIFLLIYPASAAAWPDDAQWNIVTKNNTPLIDPLGDAPNERDIVGNLTNPCCYFFNNGTALFFRMRLNDNPLQGPQMLKPFGWGIEIDSNGNLDDYEWLIMINGIIKPENVTLERNDNPSFIGDPSVQSNLIRSYTQAIGGHVNVTNANSFFDNNSDFFISWYVPYYDFRNNSGLNNASAIRVFFGTSNSAHTLGADLVAGATLYQMASDWSTPMATVLSNGSINFVDSNCANNVSSVIAGNPVYIRVNDTDRNTDNLSNQTLDVTLRSSRSDIINITLKETNISSGIFTGSVQTIESEVNNSDQILQVFSPGTINATYNDSTSQGQQVLIFSVISVPDITPPAWDPTPMDQVIEFGTLFSYNVNATDHTTISYTVNDTANFSISSSTGSITNKTALKLGNYYLNISATDTSFNSNSSIIQITIQDTTAPVWDPVPVNQAIEFGTLFSYIVNAIDPASAIIYSINNTVDFSINPITGLIINNTMLNMGSYSLAITATDGSSNSNTSNITVTVQYIVPPETTIISFPPALSNSSSVNFSFSSNKPGTFECRLDVGQYSLCTDPKEYTGLSDGPHTFYVRANDSSGNLDPTPANYSWTIDANPPVITLNGTSPVTIEVGTIYTDAGATAFDTHDGDLTDSIVTVNSVNNSTVGTYFVTYNVNDLSGNPAAQVIRIVYVNDTTPPVITPNGANPVTIEVGETYIDPGATAFDTHDGDLTGSIVTVNSVDNTTVGTYTVTYNVNDSSNNPAVQVIRTVFVLDNTPPAWFPVPSDKIVEYGTNLSYDVNATDSDIPITYGVNDTVNFAIDGNGTITNKTVLLIGTYGLNISANDSFGNINYAVINVMVQDTTPPLWDPIPTNQIIRTGTNFSYDVNATDPSNPITYGIDDTTNFTIDLNGLITNSISLNKGIYSLNISANDSYGNINYALITVNVRDYSKLYTFDADFQEGVLVGLEHDTVHDQLQLSKTPSAFPFIWVPNSGEGTISKVDTINGTELGRYRVASANLPAGGNPSRTTVDLQGNVWVGNRQAGTVVKVGLYEAGQCIDRNGNGNIESSLDSNDDGNIAGSELLSWGQDECVLYEVVLIPGNLSTYAPGNYTGSYDTNYWGVSPRGLAIDASNNLWVGTWSTSKYYYINGTNGQIIQTLDVSPWGHNAYGALIDKNGILWSSELSSHVLRINTSNLSEIKKIDIPTAYGIGLDFLNHLFVGGSSKLTKIDVNNISNPIMWTKNANVIQGVTATSDNNVWVAGNSLNTVSRYDNNGNLIAQIPGFSTPSGVAVDAAGKVWATDIGSEYIRRINTSTNTIDLSKRIIGSGGHYTYSDMTGFVVRGITATTGTWTAIYDSGSAGSTWGRVSWDSYVPAGGSIEVRVRTAQTQDGLQAAAYKSANNGIDFSSIGRYIQIETTIKANPAKESPILYYMTVDEAGSRISGRVIDNVNRTGIAGVTVSTNTSLSTLTNTTGFYLLNATTGTYILTAKLEPEYYANNTLMITTEFNTVVEQEIELVEKPKGMIMGFVTNG